MACIVDKSRIVQRLFGCTEKVKGQITDSLVSQAEKFRISATGSHFKWLALQGDNESKTLGRFTKQMK